MKKEWYLLKVNVPIENQITVTITPERLITKAQASEVLKNF